MMASNIGIDKTSAGKTAVADAADGAIHHGAIHHGDCIEVMRTLAGQIRTVNFR